MSMRMIFELLPKEPFSILKNIMNETDYDVIPDACMGLILALARKLENPALSNENCIASACLFIMGERFIYRLYKESLDHFDDPMETKKTKIELKDADIISDEDVDLAPKYDTLENHIRQSLGC